MRTLLLVGILFTAGCASHLGQIKGAMWCQVHTGMTRAELIQELGAPRSASAQGKTELFEYVQDAGVFITRQTGIWDRYYVQLNDGIVQAYGPADTLNIPNSPKPSDRKPEVVKNKYADWSTARLQLRRQQLGAAIPDAVVKVGLLGSDFTRERLEKEEIEMELLRRFEAGDAAAELKALPRDDHPKFQGS